MALSNAEAKRQRKALLAEIAGEQLIADLAKLATLRGRIRTVKTRRQKAMATTRAKCRVGAARAREHAKARVVAIREKAREDVAAARKEEISKARSVCNLRKARVRRAALGAGAKRRELLKAERAYQRDIKRIEGWSRRRQHMKTSAAERRGESDDEVRGNIDADLVALFEKVKRSIKGSTRQSRTEDFLNYAAEHPSEVVDAQVELSQRELAKLLHEEARLARAVRHPGKGWRTLAAELADIPF